MKIFLSLQFLCLSFPHIIIIVSTKAEWKLSNFIQGLLSHTMSFWLFSLHSYFLSVPYSMVYSSPFLSFTGAKDCTFPPSHYLPQSVLVTEIHKPYSSIQLWLVVLFSALFLYHPKIPRSPTPVFCSSHSFFASKNVNITLIYFLLIQVYNLALRHNAALTLSWEPWTDYSLSGTKSSIIREMINEQELHITNWQVINPSKI